MKERQRNRTSKKNIILIYFAIFVCDFFVFLFLYFLLLFEIVCFFFLMLCFYVENAVALLVPFLFGKFL